MNYTWGEIQILSLQKMFLNNVVLDVADLPTYKTNRKYSLYLDAMPMAANEGLLRLMSVGVPRVRKYSLSNNIPDEIYDYQDFETHHVTTTDLEIEGAASKAYYFEISNDAVIKIYTVADGVDTLVQTITHSANIANTYEIYKGLITNATPDAVKIVFEASDYMYDVRNIALYNINFKYEDDIFDNTKLRKFPLKTLIPDFYDILSLEYEKEETQGYYNVNWTLEGDETLVIDGDMKGNFIITYKAYPEKITKSTSDSYKFTQPAEMVALLPLYIASELYKDDDISQATIFRNEFETALYNTKTIERPLEFANKSNWL